jgi:hypothetical protein
MKGIAMSIAFAAMLSMTVAPAEIAAQTPMARLLGSGSMSGYWTGTYNASQVPNQNFAVSLVFHQSGSSVTGGFVTASGVYGRGSGRVTGSTAIVSWINTTPQCPGRYQATYQISGNTLTWTYRGRDCLGTESGSGSATR